MKISDFTMMGFKNLWRRKLRTVLTMVGVAIGAFSIVIMMSLGIALKESYTKELSDWGSLTQITIEKFSFVWDDSSNTGSSKENKLDDKMIAAIKKIDHVRAVTPIMSVNGSMKFGKYTSYLSVYGIDPEAMQYFDFPKIKSGDTISNSNPTGILFGSDSYRFYNPRAASRNIYAIFDENPVDIMKDNIKYTFEEARENKQPKYSKLNVAGVMEESNTDKGYSAYAPIEQVKKWKKEQQKSSDSKSKMDLSYDSVWVSVDDTKNVVEVQDKIKAMGYSVYSMADQLDNVNEMTNTLQIVLGGIGAVSLVVSAIGIANTMVMSIYERTKEIGVMKVLGCIVTDIRKLFLFEAGIIGLLGGILGLSLSYFASYVLNNYAPQFAEKMGISSGSEISIIPIWLSIASLVFSIVIGMVSGLYPAIKATKIKAIEAMRSAG